jgi:hypothetical protein
MSSESIQVPREIIDQLVLRYNAMLNSMRALDVQAEAQITRWQWASGEYYSLRPLYHERYAAPHGQLLSGEPTKAGDVWLFGFDANDRLLAIYHYRVHDEPDDADFLLYDDQGVEVVRYVNTHFGTADSFIMKGVARVQGSLSQPAWYAALEGTFGDVSVWYEQYQYEGDRLVEARLQRRAGIEADAPTHPQTHRISYGANGKPSVTIDDPYRRSMEAAWGIRTETTAAAPSVVQSLGQAAIDAVQTDQSYLRGVGSFCWLCMDYDAVSDPGMMITFGSQAHRAEFMASTYERSFLSLVAYRSADTNLQMLIIDSLPAEVDAFIDARREDKDWGAVRDLFTRAAKALNDFDWGALLNVTDDFMVFADDREAMADLTDAILECVPEEKIELWRANGWFS